MGKHHVVPHSDGWAVKAEGKTRASAVFATQGDAIAAAKKIAANQGGYVLIHRRDGTIRTEKVERIAGTIKVDVASGESLTVVQHKIERANKRLRVLADKVATKKKKRDKKAAAKKPTAKKPAARKAAAKKPTAKKPAAKKPAAKKPAAKKPAAKKPAAKKPAAKKAAPKKMVGGKGLKVIIAGASRAMRKLVSKK
jgi:hypothetical protein